MSLDSMLGRSLAIAASVALLSLTACDEKFAGRGLSGLVPRGAPACSEAAMQSLMESARDLGSAFGVGVAWDENGVGNIPDQVHIVGMFGVPDVVVLGAFDDVLDDPTLRAPLESMLVEMLLERPVAFLGLGNEIDMHDRFEERAALIEDLIQLVHSVGTDTVVFTVFQYEHLRTQPDPKAMVDAVPSADLVAFTVYPWLAYPDVAAMPEDYFGPILEWTTKPVAFTEMGWPSRGEHPGAQWIHGSEDEQLRFIERFAEEAEPRLPLIFANWFALHDLRDWQESDPIQAFVEVFDSVGLRRNDGSEKPAYAAWRCGSGTRCASESS